MGADEPGQRRPMIMGQRLVTRNRRCRHRLRPLAAMPPQAVSPRVFGTEKRAVQ